MGDSILITGVAGSGKSAVCLELMRRGYAAYDIENMPGLFAFIDKSTRKAAGDYGGDDPKWFERHSWTCDRQKLTALVLANRQGLAFYCGIASNLDDLLTLFDKVILLRASAATLRKRLVGRSTDDFGYGPAIQEWLLGWKEEWEDAMVRKGALVINADQTISKVANEIVSTIGKRPNAGRVSRRRRNEPRHGRRY